MKELFIAARKGDTDTVLSLLDKGANLNVKDDYLGYTALMIVSANGFTNIVRILLGNRANVNAKSRYGDS